MKLPSHAHVLREALRECVNELEKLEEAATIQNDLGILGALYQARIALRNTANIPPDRNVARLHTLLFKKGEKS